MLKRISMLLIVLSIIACSKKEKLNYTKSTVNGVEIITNENRPADSSFKIEMKEIFSIDGNSGDSAQFLKSFDIAALDFDSAGNLFLLDAMQRVIHKYDQTGKHLLSFGGRGKGPGELGFAPGLIVIRDSVFAFDQRQMKIVKYDCNGLFSENLLRTSENMVYFPVKYGNKLLDAVIGNRTENGKEVMIDNIKLYNDHFQFVNTAYENRFYPEPTVYNPIDQGSTAAVILNDSNLCSIEKSVDHYQLNISDLKGNKKGIIRKKYARISYTPADLEKLKKECEEYGFTALKADAKPAIKWLDIDKFGRLWVKPSTENEDGNLVYDIFEHGVFINRVTIPANSGSWIGFKGKYLLIINPENKLLKFYDYK